MRSYHYSEWDGSQDIFEADVDALIALISQAAS